MFPGGFLQFFYQWKQEWMLYREVTKFTTPPPTMSPHYLLKLKTHKQRILKSVVTVFHNSTEEWDCAWDKWAVFLLRPVQNVRLVRKFLYSSLLAENLPAGIIQTKTHKTHVTLTFNLWPWDLIGFYIEVAEMYVRGKFHQAECSGSWLIVLTEKKTSRRCWKQYCLRFRGQ